MLRAFETLYPAAKNLDILSQPWPSSSVSMAHSANICEAFRQSLGRWNPDTQRYRLQEEQSLSLKEASQLLPEDTADCAGGSLDIVITPDTRIKLIALIIESCEATYVPSIVATFPTSTMLEHFAREFFRSHLRMSTAWIHPSFLDSKTPNIELLVACIAAGAARSMNETLRKFGLALAGTLNLHFFKIV